MPPFLPSDVRLSIIRERPVDAARIAALMDEAFGPERFQKTAYRLRQGIRPDPRLCFVAIDQRGHMRGSIRFYPVLTPGASAVLLGPLALDRDSRGSGTGQALIRRGLDTAAENGTDLCFVVGEPQLYGRFGFTNAAQLGFSLPGPVETRRFLLTELRSGVLREKSVSGAELGAAPQSPDAPPA